MKLLKNFSTALLLTLLFSALLFSSCSTSDPESTVNPNPSNPGLLNLIAIDTAKVVKMTETGTNPIVVLNRKINLNSYISDFCFSPDGTKFIYVDQQQSGTVPNIVRTVKLKIANADGSGDTDLYSAQNTNFGSYIFSIKYCSDGKIFFATKEYSASGNASSVSFHTINSNGSNDVVSTMPSFEIDNISNNRRFYIQNGVYPNLTNTTTITDNTLDGGSGTFLQVTFATNALLSRGCFTNDEKYALIPFQDSNDIKVKIIDMATKTISEKTIISGVNSGYISFRLNMASDSNRGVLTITGENYPKSKSYVFNLNTAVVNTAFENNDENIIDVYAY